MIRDTARDYCQDKLASRVISAYLEERTDREIFTEMGALGLLGVTLPEKYGCAGANYVSYGLVARQPVRDLSSDESRGGGSRLVRAAARWRQDAIPRCPDTVR